MFRTCDPKELNLPKGVTWKSATKKKSITFKFSCPKFSAVKNLKLKIFYMKICSGKTKENQMQE